MRPRTGSSRSRSARSSPGAIARPAVGGRLTEGRIMGPAFLDPSGEDCTQAGKLLRIDGIPGDEKAVSLEGGDLFFRKHGSAPLAHPDRQGILRKSQGGHQAGSDSPRKWCAASAANCIRAYGGSAGTSVLLAGAFIIHVAGSDGPFLAHTNTQRRQIVLASATSSRTPASDRAPQAGHPHPARAPAHRRLRLAEGRELAAGDAHPGRTAHRSRRPS